MAPPEPPKKPDPLVLLARASSAKRRRPWWPALLLLLLLGGGAAGVVWWFWPRSEYPRLALALYDRVALPGEKVSLTASFELLETTEKDPNLVGSPVFLREAGAQEPHRKTCDAAGFAVFEWQLAPDREVTELVASYPGVPGRRPGVSLAPARVYSWPAETGFLIVDADRTLTEDGEADFWNTNNVDLKLRAGAAAALQAAKKMKVIYFSREADRATRGNKLRAWLDTHAEGEKAALPGGPLLAAGSVPEEARPRFAEATAASLSTQFRGRRVGVTGDPELAGLFHKAGLETWLLGSSEEAPAGGRAVKSWAELRKQLGP